MDAWPELSIGEVARRAGIAASTIRYYESIELLPEPAREGGRRRYDEAVLGRLGFIDVAKAAGFSLDEIRELLVDSERGEGMGSAMRSLSSEKLDEVEELLERTRARQGWLQVAKRCGCASPDECALFPAPGEAPADRDALMLTYVKNGECRRAPA